MNNRVKKVFMLTGILCVMGITLCACQGTKEVSDENLNKEEIGGTDSKEKDIPNEDQESNTENTDKANGSQSEANGGDINTVAPNLEGRIKDIQENSLLL